MRKIAFLSLIAVSLFGVDWLSYKDGLKEQAKSNKVIMIDVVRTDCHYCINMDREVFADEKMGTWLEERFILVKINLDKETMPLGIKTSFTPSFFFVNSDSKIVKKVPGSWNIADFKSLTEGIK